MCMHALGCHAGAQDLSREAFVARFEAPRVPVVITGLADEWPAGRRWTLERLCRDFGRHKFKVGWLVGTRACMHAHVCAWRAGGL